MIIGEFGYISSKPEQVQWFNRFLRYLKNKNIKSWFVASKYYQIRPGLYDINGSQKKRIYIKDYSI